MANESEEEFCWGAGSTSELVVELAPGAGRGTADASKVAGGPDVADVDWGAEPLAGADAGPVKLAFDEGGGWLAIETGGVPKEPEEGFDWGVELSSGLVVEFFTCAGRAADAVKLAERPGVMKADWGSELRVGSDAKAVKLASG